MAYPAYTQPTQNLPADQFARLAQFMAQNRSPYSSSPAERAAQRNNRAGTSILAAPAASAAPSAPAPVPPAATPPSVPAPTTSMGRITDAMAGPPVPTEGPPEPPISDKSMLETTDPLVLQQILQLGDLDRQMAFAEALRDKESPTGKTMWSKHGGQMYVAGSPLEHASVAFGKFRGKRQADKIGQQQIDGRMKILDILRNQ